MDPNSWLAHEYANTVQRLIDEGRLPGVQSQSQAPAPAQPVPRRTKVLTPRFAGPVNPDTPRFLGLPERIEVPTDLQRVVTRRFYRELQCMCGCFYEGYGPINGFYGWPLCPRSNTSANHVLWVGAWAMRLAFAHVPDDKSRTGVVMSLEQMAPLMDRVQRRAIIEAFTYSEQALTYKVPLSFGSGAAREMLQAG